MENFDENDLKVYKALANLIISEVTPIKQKFEKKADKIIQKIKALDYKISISENLEVIGKLSKKSEGHQKNLIDLLARKNRIDILIKRNKERISFIDQRFRESGIYDEKIDKHIISDSISKAMTSVSDENLNLNQKLSSKTVGFIDGELLVFENNTINFSNPENFEILKSSSKEYFHKIVSTYPYIISTIPEDLFLDVNFKQKVLKEIAAIATEQTETKSIADINREFGNLLIFKNSIIKDAETYMDEVKNLFDVTAKQKLREKLPNLMGEIDDKLNVNESSEFLPQSKRIAVLSNGVSGDVKKTEEEESEEVRKDKEKEAELINELNNLFETMFSAESEESEKEEQNENDNQLKDAEIEVNEQKEKEKIEEEIEEQMSALLKKHDD